MVSSIERKEIIIYAACNGVGWNQRISCAVGGFEGKLVLNF
jgi:hypothetical protein